FESLQHLDAAEARHVQVQDNQMGEWVDAAIAKFALPGHILKNLVAVTKAEHISLGAVALQTAYEQRTVVRVVVGDQDEHVPGVYQNADQNVWVDDPIEWRRRGMGSRLRRNGFISF